MDIAAGNLEAVHFLAGGRIRMVADGQVFQVGIVRGGVRLAPSLAQILKCENPVAEHYIPLRKHDLIELLCADVELSAQEQTGFREFCRRVIALYHLQYHDRLETLKNAYAPFDPDAVTAPLTALATDRRQQRLDELLEHFTWLMERANFIHLSHNAIKTAMEEVSYWGLNLVVDFDVFERLEIFVRGDLLGKRTRRNWRRWFRLEEVQVPTYQRLVLLLKFRKHKLLPKDVDTADVYLKLFKDIPKADLEMLLPGARLQMSGLTRLKMGGSLVSGLGYILYQIITEVFLAAGAIGVGVFWGPLAALLGYGYKQYYGYQTTKQSYSLHLTQSLYYQNLDNNAGVLYHLLDEAEEQECREAVLAYYYLWRRAAQDGWTSGELDEHIEDELQRLAKIRVDFEIDDALDKLAKLGIVSKLGERYRADPLRDALACLNEQWSAAFRRT